MHLHPPTVPVHDALFDADFIHTVTDIFENKIVFNHLLGLRVSALHAQRVSAGLHMRPDLVGHFTYQRIHGGVISAALDAVGGLAVMAAMGARHHAEPVPQRLSWFAKLGTIDLRVDYLRPGMGEVFHVQANVLRLGSRVASTRMEFFGADGKLLATGAGAYMVS